MLSVWVIEKLSISYAVDESYRNLTSYLTLLHLQINHTLTGVPLQGKNNNLDMKTVPVYLFRKYSIIGH